MWIFLMNVYHILYNYSIRQKELEIGFSMLFKPNMCRLEVVSSFEINFQSWIIWIALESC